jgi:hypothetical protein
LGGRHSNFKFGPGAAFAWQHDVQVYPGTPYLTMFDDHCCQITGGGTYVAPTAPSRGLVLRVDPASHTAALSGQYTHGANFDADYMGSLQPLPGGNELVGWGSAPYFSEHDASDRRLLDARLPGPDLSYRATVEPWVGLPLYPPAGAARQASGQTTVYASWNGATEVARWRVLASEGSSAGVGRLRPVATAAKAGFETAIPVPAGEHTFQVEAVDAGGRVIGSSPEFTPH